MTATSGEPTKVDNGMHQKARVTARASLDSQHSRSLWRIRMGHRASDDNLSVARRPLQPSRSIAAQSLIFILCIAASAPSDAFQYSDIAAVASTVDGSAPLYQKGIKGSSQVANDVIAIKEGADLDLSCPIVVQNEDMIISWTCDDDPANIRSSRIHVTDSGKLRIHSAKVGDSCNYRCEAADGFGTLSVIIKVIIVDRRLMDQWTKRAGIDNGSNSSISDDQMSETQTPSRHVTDSKHSKALQQSNQKLKSQTDGGLDIEMYIEPSEVRVDKNRTFSLECRIKHAPNQVPPQIIWLKEYIGAHIDSLNEAIEKNLLVIDGVYYHSLNWPRQTSYSEKSSTASSALLVKQAAYVHSGRYACFAGYPASIMNLHFNNTLSGQTNVSTLGPPPPRPSMRYKIAQASVKIDDAIGESNYKSSLEYLDREENSKDPHAPTNILVSVVSSNTWVRNLTVILLVFCISLTMFKYIGTAKRKGTRKNAQTNVDLNSSTVTATSSQMRDPIETQHPVATVPNPVECLPEFLPDRFNPSHVPTNSLMNDTNPLGERYEIDQALLNERLNSIDANHFYSKNDHVYSEIGYKISINDNEEPYYKKPNRMNK